MIYHASLSTKPGSPHDLSHGSGSQVLFWDDEERGDWGPGILRLKENGMLVFGGDAPDKGPGDIRLVTWRSRGDVLRSARFDYQDHPGHGCAG